MPLILILMAAFANGALTCTVAQSTTAGTSSGYIRTNAQFINITGIESTLAENATAAEISIAGVTIAGAIQFNDTALNFSKANFSFSTINLSDNTSYTLTASLKNDSTQTEIGTCTATLIPDNTVPVFSSQSPSTDTDDVDGTIDFSVIAVNVSSTESGTLYLSGTSYAMSRSSNTFTLTKKLDPGVYDWYTEVSDGLNITTDSTRTIRITSDASGGSGGGPEFIQTTIDKRDTKKGLAALGITSEGTQEAIANAKARAKFEATTPKEIGKTASATLVGAGLGTWVFPGVGTVVGGAIGFVGGIIW
jgi:hypothetical protein